MIAAHCVRAQLEAREAAQLSPFAARSSETKGRAVPEEEDAYRTVYQRDRDRILHTKAFRRLKRKTQVFLAPTGDHFRTRLTHTLEVAQISRTVSRALFLNEDLTEAIALGHDLGHTPFGHAGLGLNLTHEVRDGILYHSKGKAVLQGRVTDGPNTLEGAVVSVCDAIAYINHDIDDAIRAGVIATEDLPQDALSVLGDHTSSRIDAMVVGIIQGSQEGKLGIVPEILEAMNALRDFMYTEVYPCEAIDREIRKAKKILRELYFYLLDDPNEEIIHGLEGDSLERRTVDFAAGMTDEFALQLYQRLFFPKPW